MGACCQNARNQIEDETRVVVVNVFKDFEKETRYQGPYIRQAKTEINQIITIKQLTNNNNEFCQDTLIRLSETIIKKNEISENLHYETVNPNMISKPEDTSIKQMYMSTTSMVKPVKEKQKQKKKKKLNDHQISTEEQAHIKQIFHKLFIFDVFPENTLDILLSNLILYQIVAGSHLYKKGFKNHFFYIVLEGTLEVYKDDKIIKVYREWDSFGHSSLISNDHIINLDESVKAVENTKLFILSGETFLSIKKKIIEFQMKERYDFINTIIFFKTLDSITKHNIAEKMKSVTFYEKDTIISKGDKGNNIYMIQDGSVSCQVNSVEVKHLGISKYFGIISLLQKCTRTLDVIAKEKCKCFELSTRDLEEAIGNNYIEVILFSIFKEYLFKSTFFTELILEEKVFELFQNFSLKSYEKNENIYLQSPSNNESNKRIIIVLEGNLVNQTSKKIEYNSGGVIGEEIVKNYVDIPQNLIAYPDCLTLETNVELIPNLLGEEFKANTMSILTKVMQLQKLNIFARCSESLLKQIVLDIKKEKYHSNEVIIREDTPGEFFFIILKGRVEISINNRKIRTLEEDSFFGEKACMNTSEDAKYSATVKALTEVNCIKMAKNELLTISNNDYVSQLLKKQMILQNVNIDLNNLKLIKHIGNGKFGSVDLVYNNDDIYAIKAINRKDADSKKRMAAYLQEERRLLLNVDHPLIGKIVKTFQNEYYVFLLLEYINGQNLKSFLESHQNLLTVHEVMFYISSLLLVIDYLNKKKIVHRDIKLNNIILDTNGYLKLIDFGTAKLLNDYTNTIIGTPHYMSPEVLRGKGYSFSCDYWSIGICAYEMFFKKYPFGNEATEVMEIYNEIIYSEYSYPSDREDSNYLNEFIHSILQKQVTRRICSLNKFKNLKFFEKLDWNELFLSKIPSPFKPSYIEFKEIDLKLFKSSYEEYINRDMYLNYNQNNYRDYNKTKNDFQWAKEFDM